MAEPLFPNFNVSRDATLNNINGFPYPLSMTALTGSIEGLSFNAPTYWFNYDTSTTSYQAVVIAFDCEIAALSVAWSSNSNITLGPNDSVTFEIGFPTKNEVPNGTNFNVVPNTEIVWNVNQTGSFPSDFRVLNIPVPKGTLLSVRATEQGVVSPGAGDVTIIVWLRGQFLS